MSLLGKAVVAIWNDITPEGRDTFIEWHNREHIPERVAIAGFRRGRRYGADYGAPEYYTLYEADDAQVLTGPDYLERLNNPTPWTRQATGAFRNTLRGVCGVVFSDGSGDGGMLMTLRFDADGRNRNDLSGYIVEQLKEIGRMKGISGTHLCVADTSASSIETAERKGRNVDVPNWIVMIEGSSRAALEAVAGLLNPTAMAGRGLAGAIEQGFYRLEFSLTDMSAIQTRNERKAS